MAVCLSGHVFPHFLLPPLSGCPLCFTLFKKRLYCKESRFLFLSFFFVDTRFLLASLFFGEFCLLSQ